MGLALFLVGFNVALLSILRYSDGVSIVDCCVKQNIHKTDRETWFNGSREPYVKGNDVCIVLLVFISVSSCIHFELKSEKNNNNTFLGFFKPLR